MRNGRLRKLAGRIGAHEDATTGASPNIPTQPRLPVRRGGEGSVWSAVVPKSVEDLWVKSV